jgi:hypothetical protein
MGSSFLFPRIGLWNRELALKALLTDLSEGGLARQISNLARERSRSSSTARSVFIPLHDKRFRRCDERLQQYQTPCVLESCLTA